MADLKITANAAGQGSMAVDGVDVRYVQSVDVRIDPRAGTTVEVRLVLTENTLDLVGANLVVGGVVMPASLEHALYAYLCAKRGHAPLDVTTIADKCVVYTRQV